MQIKLTTDNGVTTLEVIEHRVICRTYHFMANGEGDFKRQVLNFIEELSQSSLQFKGKHKQLLKALSVTDSRFEDDYKSFYPKGGIRRNAGRKQGSTSTTPRTERTERFTMAITQEEKEFLIQQLTKFREKLA